jgi:hypothetical protein
MLLALPIAMLLILTAWGNALAMFAVSTFALLFGMLLFNRDDEVCTGDGLAAIVGASAAVAVAVATMMWNLL